MTRLLAIEAIVATIGNMMLPAIDAVGEVPNPAPAAGNLGEADDADNGESRDFAIDSIRRCGNTVEVELLESEAGMYRILEMEDDWECLGLPCGQILCRVFSLLRTGFITRKTDMTPGASYVAAIADCR